MRKKFAESKRFNKVQPRMKRGPNQGPIVDRSKRGTQSV